LALLFRPNKTPFLNENGGPEVLKYEEVPIPSPKTGEVLIKTEAIGVNFIDVYYRTGLYPLPLPTVIGMEASGRVEALASGDSGMEVGDRVAYAMTLGSYAEYALVPAGRLVKLPERVDAQHGAAAMLQGMTAHYLTTSTYPLKKGEAALIHAAAGGVGLLLIQLAKRFGARVISTVSTYVPIFPPVPWAFRKSRNKNPFCWPDL
jgi:NADPH:quinone reductase